MKKIKINSDVFVVMFNENGEEVTLEERNKTILKLEEHINSFPLLRFDNITTSIRIHMKGEPNETEIINSTCDFDCRHNKLRDG